MDTSTTRSGERLLTHVLRRLREVQKDGFRCKPVLVLVLVLVLV
jgi:hypothetical protein